MGNYDANNGKIEAEDYFKASGIAKTEITDGFFVIDEIEDGDYLVYQKVKGLENKSKIQFAWEGVKATLEIREGTPNGKLLTTCNLDKETTEFDFPSQQSPIDLCFVFKGQGKKLLSLNSFEFN